MTDKNTLFSGILGYQFKLDIMVPQTAKESPKTSEGPPVSLLVKIPETQNNMEDRDIMYSTMELKWEVIHQYQTPGNI